MQEPQQSPTNTSGKRPITYRRERMTCAACGAASDPKHAFCVICGHRQKPDTKKEWDRSVEASAYEDLQKTLSNGEAILGATRGRIAGGIRGKAALNPQ